jgi:ABC-2 type transport system permease protein
MYLLAVCVNAIGLLWSAGIAMRFRSLQAAPLMQLPIFLTLFFAPVFVPLAMLAHWLRLIAHVNPVTLFLEAGRGLISGSPTHVGHAFLVAVTLVALFAVWALRGLRKAEAAGG